MNDAPPVAAVFDVQAIRAQFPILAEQVRGKPLVFLDSAASAQKPRAVIEAMVHAMEHQYANVHRGLHWMSERTTDAYEACRDAVARLLNARERAEIVFVRNSTEAINLVAYSYGRGILKPGDAVLVSQMEHHSNLVPWQILRDAHGVELRIAPVTDAGELDFPAYEALLADGRVKLVAITHMSNVLGTYVPAERVVAAAHAAGAKVLFDGSQAVVHRRVDVQALDADFYVFTGHKLYGPTGIGVLYGRAEALAALPPWQGGGEMIESVSTERVTYAPPPMRFEAGTPPIIEAIGLGAAIDWLAQFDRDAVHAHEKALHDRALERINGANWFRPIGQAPDKGAILSFTVEGAHAHDIAQILDRYGVAVRAGQHCAEPLMRRFDVTSSVRASFALYNTPEEADAFVDALIKARGFFV